jgi:hypothetical protein
VTINNNQDFWDGWDAGWLDGVSEHKIATRIEAFGAIRRAAKVAKLFDSFRLIHEVDGDIYKEEMAEAKADAIRRAIRAAIGSEKT